MKVAIHRCSICQSIRLASNEGSLDRFSYSQRVLRFSTVTRSSVTASAVLLAIPATVVPCAADEMHDWQPVAVADVAQTEGVITVTAKAINVAAPSAPVADPPDLDDPTFARLPFISKDQARALLAVMRDVVAGKA